MEAVFRSAWGDKLDALKAMAKNWNMESIAEMICNINEDLQYVRNIPKEERDLQDWAELKSLEAMRESPSTQHDILFSDNATPTPSCLQTTSSVCLIT